MTYAVRKPGTVTVTAVDRTARIGFVRIADAVPAAADTNVKRTGEDERSLVRKGAKDYPVKTHMPDPDNPGRRTVVDIGYAPIPENSLLKIKTLIWCLSIPHIKIVILFITDGRERPAILPGTKHGEQVYIPAGGSRACDRARKKELAALHH